LYETASTDPLAIGGTTLLVAAMVVAACLRPARTATTLDPLDALRQP
jgi:ABC-type lipoprotein release transport system permease subunit